MKKVLIPFSVFVLTAALFSGCAPKLLKSPEEAGVIVLEGNSVTTGILTKKGALSSTEKNLITATLVNSKGDTFTGQQYYWYVIFGDLPPGTYHISSVNDSGSPSGEITLMGSKLEKFTIKAGELKYIGVLEVKRTEVGMGIGGLKLSSVNSPYSVSNDPEDEKSAWERLADAYKKTPWGKRMKKRAAEL